MTFHVRYTSTEDESANIARAPEFDMRYSPDLVIASDNATMAPNELDAARKLATFQQPVQDQGSRQASNRLNCMLDGQCQSARTKDCTDACHSCEAPQSCDGGAFCDPKSVCKDPNCQEEAMETEFCVPCSSHDHMDYAASPPKREYGQVRDMPRMPGLYGHYPTGQGSTEPYSDRYHSWAWPDFSHNPSPEFHYHGHGSVYPSTSSMPYQGNQFLGNTDNFFATSIQPGFADGSHISQPRTPTQSLDSNVNGHPFFNIVPDLAADSMLSPSELTSSMLTRSSSVLSHEFSERRQSRSSTMSSLPRVFSCRWITHLPIECTSIHNTAEELHEHILKEHIGPMGGRGHTRPEKEPMICRWAGCKAADDMKKWTALQHVKDHMVCHSGVRETCDRCGKKLRDKKSLKAHKLQCGNESGQKMVPCDICGKKFSSQSTLKQHMNVHSGKFFYCSECNHKTTDQSNLRKHMKTHSKDSEGKYRCKCCNKAFRNNFNMKRHEKNMIERRKKDKSGSVSGSCGSTGCSTPGKASTPTGAASPVGA